MFNTSTLSGAKTTGNVKTATDFKYAVQVTDAEGNKLPENVVSTDYVDVKVANANKAVSIETVTLSNELDYLTIGAEDVKFTVTAAKNALGEDLTEESLVALVPTKVVSSDTKVAYYDLGASKIVARAAGTVTFTLTYGTGTDAITVEHTTEVKEVGVATSIEASNQSVATETETADLEFKVFDQHGLDITANTNAYKVVITDSEGFVVADLKLVDTYTVKITDLKDNELGTFKVTTVDVTDAAYDSFSFVEDDKEVVLDVNVDDLVKQKTLTLKGVKSGVTVVASELELATDEKMAIDGYYLVSSDTKVVKATLKDGIVTLETADELNKAATAQVQLIKVAGDIKEVLATYDVEVKNTTPVVESLTLKDDKTSVLVKNTEKETLETALKALLTAGTKELEDGTKTEILDYDKMVELVTFIPGNNVVEVKIFDLYGGKTFEFDVTVDNVKPTVKAATAVVDGNPVRVTTDENDISLSVEQGKKVEKITFTFSEAVTTDEVITVYKGEDKFDGFTGELSEDGKVLTFTLAEDADITSEVGEVTFTLKNADGVKVATFTDIAGNVATVPTVTLTVTAAPASEEDSEEVEEAPAE